LRPREHHAAMRAADHPWRKTDTSFLAMINLAATVIRR
jgi:hypothetical protein